MWPVLNLVGTDSNLFSWGVYVESFTLNISVAHSAFFINLMCVIKAFTTQCSTCAQIEPFADGVESANLKIFRLNFFTQFTFVSRSHQAVGSCVRNSFFTDNNNVLLDTETSQCLPTLNKRKWNHLCATLWQGESNIMLEVPYF